MTVEMNYVNGPSCQGKGLQGWLERLQRRSKTRFLMALVAAVLVAAVSIDSSQNRASAADMGTLMPEITFPEVLQAERSSRITGRANADQLVENTYLEFDPETAERLRHSGLTSASLTSNRLTSAHLFTRQLR